MSTFTHNARVYEVTGLGPVDQPGFHYECWDLSPQSGGMLGRIVVPDPGDDSEIQVEIYRPLPASVLLKWFSFVPELQRHSIAPDSH